jgi:hypothetical protein
MKFKKAFIGGTEDAITKEEIAETQKLLGSLKVELALLKPYLKTLTVTLPDPSQLNPIEFHQIDAAVDQLGLSLNALWPQNRRVRLDLNLLDLQIFLRELNVFMNRNPLLSQVSIWEKWIPVLNSLTQWSMNQDTVLEGYKLFLHYELNLSGKSFYEPQYTTGWNEFLLRSFNLVEKTISLNKSKRLSFKEIDHVIDELQKVSFFHLPISQKILKSLYKKAISVLLDTRRGDDQTYILGLEERHLALLKRELSVWTLIQDFLKDLPSGEITSQRLQDLIKSYSVEKKISLMSGLNSYDEDEIKRSWKEFWNLLDKTSQIQWANGSLKIQPKNNSSQNRTYTREGLAISHCYQMLTRFVFIGYAQQFSSMNLSWLSLNSLRLAYSDLTDFGLEMGFIDPRVKGAPERSLIEGNLFTSIGDGDAFLNKEETFEWFQLLFYGAFKKAPEWKKDFVNCQVFKRDIFGNQYLHEECFENLGILKLPQWMGNLKKYRPYYQKLSLKQKQDFMKTLISVARSSHPDGKLIETSDVNTMVMMLVYTESLITQFDSNHNGVLDSQEALKAYPRFSTLLKKYSSFSSDVILEDAFLYLLYKGKQPDLTGYLAFEVEKTTKGLGEVGPLQILKVFGVLSKPK